MAKNIGKRLCQIQQQSSYWKGYRDRVRSAAVRESVNPLTGEKALVLAPGICPMNTVSLRTGEPLFLTLASHVVPKPGAEIKCMIKALPGHNIVSYDFQSQELQGLSAYSASYSGVSGSTPFDYGNLVGDKKTKTDVHSLVAQKAGTGRDAAKQSIYAICYGGGAKAVARTICLWHPEYDRTLATRFAKKIIANFKGTKARGQTRFAGGTASLAFNKMLDLLAKPKPISPLLGTAMAPATWPANCGQMASPGQMNWMVQNLGSSMLHATIVGNWYYARKHNIHAPLAITCHDEEAYQIRSHQARMFAYIMQIVHCQTWCLLHYKLGIFDMPTGRAFMQVSIDSVWRKEPKQTIETPTYKLLTKGKDLSIIDLSAEGELLYAN